MVLCFVGGCFCGFLVGGYRYEVCVLYGCDVGILDLVVHCVLLELFAWLFVGLMLNVSGLSIVCLCVGKHLSDVGSVVAIFLIVLFRF